MEEFIPLLPPLFGMVANSSIQILVYRTGSVRLLVSAVVGIVCGGAITLLAHEQWIGEHASTSEEVSLMAVNLIIYIALSYTYCHVLSMGETARRIRILFELTETVQRIRRGSRSAA